MLYSDPVALEEQGFDVNSSFSEKSLAAADSLALSPENGNYEGYPLSSDEFVGNTYSDVVDKKKIFLTRRIVLSFIAFLLVGIIVIVLSVVLTKSKNSREGKNAITAGNSAQSIDSVRESVQIEIIIGAEESIEEDVLEPEPLPDIYYQLESKVYNPALLLDMDTPEGKAFNVLLEESKTNNSPVNWSLDYLDLQRYALLVLYFGTDGGAWTSTEGWSTPSKACEGWYGVTCRNSLVIGIDLDRNNLHGKIPEDFCLMKGLKNLKLSGNQMELPSCFSKLSNLEELDFRENSFAGELPFQLYSIPSLISLNLSDNEFVGSIDLLFPELSTSGEPIFPSLTTLNLANNDLSGEVPENMLRRMSTLNTLVLHGNPKLAGSLNEICKGDGIANIDADCSMVSCKCCTIGTNCPSSL